MQTLRGRKLVSLKLVGTSDGYLDTTNGYWMLQRPGHPNANSRGSISQHLYLMSESLGRPLLPHENVHHINGIKHDNRLENLELWIRPQPSGQRLEDLLEWVVAMYPDQLKEKLHVKD